VTVSFRSRKADNHPVPFCGFAFPPNFSRHLFVALFHVESLDVQPVRAGLFVSSQIHALKRHLNFITDKKKAKSLKNPVFTGDFAFSVL